MRISVIIPCHNAGRWIRHALASAAAQTHPPHEVIVIDDDSSDDSLEQVRQSGVDARLLRAQARNAAAARNAGIERATGEWLAFLDADDVWYPTHLANAVQLLSGGRDVAYMANHHLLFEDGSVTPIPEGVRPKIDESASGLSHLRFPELLTQGFHFGHSTVLLRRDRVAEVGAFDVTQVRRHDMDLWLRTIRDRTWAWGAVPAAQYRADTPGSISKSVVNAEYFQLRALLKNLDGFAGAPMRQLVETAARRSMSLAFVDGGPRDYASARELAWPHLRPAYRLGYRAGGLCPGVLRWMIRLKRHLYVRSIRG